ncbi:asparaginase [Bosea sp. 117]|uniref:asparaginase n=1 Tax=Bosea sp. 117 TaxID=1125973 RepID=UPI000494517C|nr:asparaginase [Bosea sp. 117]
MSLPRLLVLSLGGTITMKRDPAGGIVPALGAADLVAAIPGLADVAEIEARSPLKLPSPSLTPTQIAGVAAEIRAGFKAGFDGAVVIQGTDTIEETAFALDLLIEDERPVVVTGAMRGPEAPGADGPANLLSAAIVAASAAARGLGALAVLNDEIHAARAVRKAHTALPSAFVSAAPGPLGLVAEGRARFHARLPRGPHFELPGGTDLPRVALAKMTLGDDGGLVAATPDLGYAGLVIEGMGAGHVPAEIADMVGYVASKIPVVLASRTLGGPVFTKTYGYAGSEIDLLARGLIPAGSLQGPKARLLLMFALAAGLDRDEVAAAFGVYR